MSSADKETVIKQVENGKTEVVDEAAKKAEIEKALLDPTKKRKAEDEIEIDLKSSIPLSKKQKRLLRRGKITLEELNAKYNLDPESIKQYEEEKKTKLNGESTGTEDKKTIEGKDAKIGVWIGNLAFDTTKEDIVRYIVGKTKENESDDSKVEEKDMVRFKMPMASTDVRRLKNKGFCYIDFNTEKHRDAVIALNETHLNGRNLLIKDSTNYTGRPDKNDLVAASKNPPSRILFVGNLSFDVTEDLLRSHFKHCGEIVKVRMATFEDSGKCKGFAFVDFKNEDGATKALKDKSVRKIALRPLRMEYGEDRSKRQVRRRPEDQQQPRRTFDITEQAQSRAAAPQQQQHSKPPRKEFNGPKRSSRPNNMASNNRLKSSIALASAQRGSAAIVPSQGKKTTF